MNNPTYPHLDEATCQAMAEVFRALGDPSRIRVIHALCQGERTVGKLAAEAGSSPSATSHHLRALRQLGLVRFRREGTLIFYALDDRHVASFLREAMEHVSELRRESKLAPSPEPTTPATTVDPPVSDDGSGT
jgi:DNA-binding transcriptional ArsR family regulator